MNWLGALTQVVPGIFNGDSDFSISVSSRLLEPSAPKIEPRGEYSEMVTVNSLPELPMGQKRKRTSTDRFASSQT